MSLIKRTGQGIFFRGGSSYESGDPAAIEKFMTLQERSADLDINDMYGYLGMQTEKNLWPKKRVMEAELSDIAKMNSEDISAGKQVFAPMSEKSGAEDTAEGFLTNVNNRSKYTPQQEPDFLAPTEAPIEAPREFIPDPRQAAAMYSQHRFGLPLKGGVLLAY